MSATSGARLPLRPTTLALVESPAQLLNVMELGHADPYCAGTPIAVLAPTTIQARAQLRAMAAMARDLGHPVTWHEPRLGGAAIARTVGAMASQLAGVQHLIIGDPFSGVMQVIITLTRPSTVTIVDDGTATLEFARQWASGEHLARWHQVATPPQRRHIALLARAQIADTVRRRLCPEAGCHLRVFSCLNVELPRVEVLVNDFAWLRGAYGPPVVTDTADLVGTSLVESGVITGPAYRDAVIALMHRYGITRYFSHRLETEQKLRTMTELGLEVVRPRLPLELVARQGPIGRTVVSFPSTVVHTLPVALADVGVEVVVRRIEEEWFASRASLRADSFLGEVTGSAQRRHGLLALDGARVVAAPQLVS